VILGIEFGGGGKLEGGRGNKVILESGLEIAGAVTKS
jgi:hypothetical protein